MTPCTGHDAQVTKKPQDEESRNDVTLPADVAGKIADCLYTEVRACKILSEWLTALVPGRPDNWTGKPSSYKPKHEEVSKP